MIPNTMQMQEKHTWIVKHTMTTVSQGLASQSPDLIVIEAVGDPQDSQQPKKAFACLLRYLENYSCRLCTITLPKNKGDLN